jgi:hypothetical protein
MASPQFVFNNAVPQATQKLATTQAPILSNFQAINELINTNHVSFSDVVNYGKHNLTTFPLQSILPTTSAGQMSIYCAAAATVNGMELFYQYPSNGTRVQLTPVVSSGADAANPGYTTMPGGVIMKWGTATGLVPGANTILFPVGGGIPAYTTSVFTVQYTPGSTNANSVPGPYINNITLSQFQFNVPVTTASTIYWISIGI